MIRYILLCLAFLPFVAKAGAQDSFSCRAHRYIEQYYSLAMAEQRRSGVPASVTLAQGVLETEAGRSELVCMANNHFGIKCKTDYQGDKFFHDDDAPKECFKMYRCAEDSYKDHSDYLKRNPRYNPLFAISQTDYASWAVGLKRCGYATNPQYAQRLIKIIEDFKLQEYTYTAMDSTGLPGMAAAVWPVTKDSARKIIPQPVSNIALAAPPPQLSDTAKKAVAAATPADTAKVTANATPFAEVKEMADKARAVIAAEDKPAPVTKTIMVTDTVATAIAKPAGDFDSGKLVTMNGLKAFYAYKGDMLLLYAVKYNIRYPHLLEINDLSDAPLADNTIIYLEKKLNSGTHARHTVKEEDNIYLIAQEEGMSLRRLQTLNMLEPAEEPAPGVFLELQNGATRKPTLRAAPPANLKTGNNLSYVKPTPADSYIQIDHTATADAGGNTVAVKREIARDAYVTTIAVPVDSSGKSGIKTSIDTSIVNISDASNRILDSIVKGEDTAQDEFAVLKAKLDKVVYSGKPKTKTPPATAEAPHVDAKEDGSSLDIIKLTPISDKPERKPAKPVLAAAKGSGYYTVKKGDNLSRIADKNNVTVKQIMRLNHVEADELQPGQKLRMK